MTERKPINSVQNMKTNSSFDTEYDKGDYSHKGESNRELKGVCTVRRLRPYCCDTLDRGGRNARNMWFDNVAV